uniref:MSP domain-containing protein n=1 Tax=Caenorhabditis japonica TaxID=281687 RepID=A0A8R1EWS2_CAEJA
MHILCLRLAKKADRIAVKITCSDNNMYRVTPVYANVEPGQSLALHIARITSDLIKRDRLCVNILEADGNKEAREVFKKNVGRAPASINMALEATADNQNHNHRE